jgi:hypothetical protein
MRAAWTCRNAPEATPQGRAPPHDAAYLRSAGNMRANGVRSLDVLCHLEAATLDRTKCIAFSVFG